MVQFVRYVFPPLFDTFQQTYGVSNTETGLLFTLLMLGYSAAQIPAGLMGDRFGEPLTILAGVGIFSLSTVGAFIAPTFTILTLAAVLIGLGTGVHKTVAIPYLSKTYADRKGLALGIMDTVGQFGGVFAPVVVVAILASALHWGSVFLLITAVCLTLEFLFFVYTDLSFETATPSVAADRSDSNPQIEDYLGIFRNRQLLLFLLVTTIFTFVWNGIASFYPLYLTSTKGLSPDVAGIIYSLLFVASVGQLFTGDVSDRYGRLRISLILFASMIAGLGAIVASASLWLILLFTVFMGIGLHGFRPVRDAYLMELIPTAIGGGTLGVVRTVMTVIGGLAPIFVGYVSDTVGFDVAFSILIGFLLIGSLGIIGLDRSRS